MSQRCERCGEGNVDDTGLPDWTCWDRRATAEQVHEWVARIRANGRDPAQRYLAEINDPAAADALRSYLDIDDPQILGGILSALATSGDESDGPVLAAMLERSEQQIRTRAAVALTALGVPGTADLLMEGIDILDHSGDEARRLMGCLVWLKDKRVLEPLRAIFRAEGYGARMPVGSIANMLAQVGDASDRKWLADVAIEVLEKSAADGYTMRRWERSAPWLNYVRAVESIAPDEVAAVRESLSPEAAKALTWYPYETAESTPAAVDSNPRFVSRRSIVGYDSEPPADLASPPAKFSGQPDWREQPAWPVGGDGQLLMFYGQLPIGDEMTAYLFTAGPEEYTALGPGSAIVVQPGNTCHVPTVNVSTGPRRYVTVVDSSRFVRSLRSVPAPERYPILDHSADPASWDRETGLAPTDAADWNKIGGTPVWLQGDETPSGSSWRYAFQFEADLAGGERGDGAVFYGWLDDEGNGALGWQCH